MNYSGVLTKGSTEGFFDTTVAAGNATWASSFALSVQEVFYVSGSKLFHAEHKSLSYKTTFFFEVSPLLAPLF
ncbi:MAG: hypothetical protein IPP29_00770 [Bacteroidetes bacterium]|nr:hypothetical protein [Bacteroidota bacterium]